MTSKRVGVGTPSKSGAVNGLCISLVNYDSSHTQLLTCIDSIIVAASVVSISMRLDTIKIIIVHNGKALDIDREELEQYENDSLVSNLTFSLTEGQGNIGYGAGQNLAFRAETSKYHLFMNPDVELEPDALVEGLSYLEAHPEVAIASPYARRFDGSRQYLCKRFPTVLDLFLRGLMPKTIAAFFSARLARYEMQDLSVSNPTKGVPIVSGCFMLCRSALLNRVGGFDPAYFLYFEDFDLSIRVRAEGDLAFVPSMRIKHQGGDAARKGLKHIMRFCQSGLRFFRIHGVKWF